LQFAPDALIAAAKFDSVQQRSGYVAFLADSRESKADCELAFHLKKIVLER